MRTALALCAMLSAAAAAAAPTCEAKSGATSPVVVELYTSEGCNSCPPADRWLSSLKGRGDVIALAFHVDYWDRLGWVDRFASPLYTERQQRMRRASGATFIYTPQVLADGADWRRWPGALPSSHASDVDVRLVRDGDRVDAFVAPRPTAPARLSGYWAVVEDGLWSAVKAGENAGATLHHDHVVRAYRPLPAWDAAGGSRSFAFERAPAPAPNRRIVFVVDDAATAAPRQAVALGC